MSREHLAIQALIRTIPDFPKPGILFRDVSTLINDANGLTQTIASLAEQVQGLQIDRVIGIEARGFIVGAPLAMAVKAGMVMARKKGKLPGPYEECTYDLEYGTDCIQIHRDAIKPGEKCLVVDDLLATGGTAEATARLVERLGGEVVGCSFVVNLVELGGTQRLSRYKLNWLVEYSGH